MTSRHALPASRWLVTLAAALAIWAGPATAIASAPASDPATARYEIHFMEEMIDHHTMAVHMGEMCLEKATHAELLTTCQQIVTTQTQEIEVMQTWLSDWYGVTYTPEMTQGHQNMMERMAEMTAEEFEVMFLKMMIRHHWGAIVKASTCVDRASHDELVALCEDIIIAQSAEIEQMRTWLCDWYAICNYGPKGNRADET
jgi:uncharacterized protein (DUF305 family)